MTSHEAVTRHPGDLAPGGDDHQTADESNLFDATGAGVPDLASVLNLCVRNLHVYPFKIGLDEGGSAY